MNVAIVSIGTELLLTDILNTNAAHVTRRLRENKIPISCRITIGDDQAAADCTGADRAGAPQM